MRIIRHTVIIFATLLVLFNEMPAFASDPSAPAMLNPLLLQGEEVDRSDGAAEHSQNTEYLALDVAAFESFEEGLDVDRFGNQKMASLECYDPIPTRQDMDELRKNSEPCCNKKCCENFCDCCCDGLCKCADDLSSFLCWFFLCEAIL